jgi:polynucleotide 5'-hydroxyl-kinase GRC3/NOL9
MDAAAEMHLPDDWREAIAKAAGCRRILVLGATDVGKTSFIRALATERPLRLIDLDPGQKMVGPPGTASLGSLAELDRFIFLGSTSASNLRGIGLAAAALAGDAAEAFVVNTAGFVAGLGARLQAITAKAVAPDIIVEIGEQPVLPAPKGVKLLRLARSPAARLKTQSARAAVRQQAFARALEGAAPIAIDGATFHPGPPLLPEGGARPVCALADEDGRDMCLGVVTSAGEVEAPPPPRPVRIARIGKMWAEPHEGSWRLLEKLEPAWSA